MWKAGIEVGRDIGAVVLRKKARAETDGGVVARLFGIANIVDGMQRGQAARQAGMTRQTPRDGMHRYCAEGMDGLRDRSKGHAKRALTAKQEQEIAALVLLYPEGTLVRWRRVDLRDIIRERFGVVYHERNVGKILRRLGVSRLSVRRLHPESGLAPLLNSLFRFARNSFE